MLITPGGKPASMVSSPIRRAVKGVNSEGFKMTVHPNKYQKYPQISTCSKSGTKLQSLHHHGPVPGDKLTTNSNRLLRSEAKIGPFYGNTLSRDFVRPACVISAKSSVADMNVIPLNSKRNRQIHHHHLCFY